MTLATLLGLTLGVACHPHPEPRTERAGPPIVDPGVHHFLSTRVRGLDAYALVQLAVAIETNARLYQLDPKLVLSVIAVESAFDPRAVSPVGARGLMQIMPKTGRALARELGIPWRGPKTLFDPVNNVRMGTRYLAWLLGRFDGNRRLALAAYCHGPKTIRRMVVRGHVPPYRLRYARKVALAQQRIVQALESLPLVARPAFASAPTS